MSDCVVVKLVNGDTIMASLVTETDNTVVVENPVAVKTITVNDRDGTFEKTITQRFCGLTDDTEFVFDRRHVLFVASLDPKVSGFYEKLVKSFDEEVTNDLEDEDQQESFLIIPDDQMIH